jgi:uncharacterized membrane protein
MMAALRRYLVAGLLVWVPLGVTLLIITWMVNLMDRTLLLLPANWRPEQFAGFSIPGLGIVLTAVVVIGTGIAVTHLFGFHVVGLGERILARIPIVRSIYSSVKQVTETMFSNSGQSFRQVVLVRYPHRDSWTMGFLTGESAAEARSRTGRDLVNVFVPTTPNPTSGFFLLVPREEVIDLDMSVDEGLKMLLSLGVVQPKDKNKNKVLAKVGARVS